LLLAITITDLPSETPNLTMGFLRKTKKQSRTCETELADLKLFNNTQLLEIIIHHQNLSSEVAWFYWVN